MLATVANSRTDDSRPAPVAVGRELTNALNEGFQSAFLAGAGIAALGFVLTLVLVRGRDSRAHIQLGAGAQEQPAKA